MKISKIFLQSFCGLTLFAIGACSIRQGLSLRITTENNIKEDCFAEAIQAFYPDFHLANEKPTRKSNAINYYFFRKPQEKNETSALHLSIDASLNYDGKDNLKSILFNLNYSGANIKPTEEKLIQTVELLKPYAIAIQKLPKQLEEMCSLKIDKNPSLRCMGDFCDKLPEELTSFQKKPKGFCCDK